MAEDYSSFKKIGTLIGIILLIAGISITLYGFTFWGSGSKEMGEEGWFDEESSRGSSWFTYSVVGMLLIFIGGTIIYFTQIRRIAKYVAAETSPAIETVGDAMGKGVASGIKEGGGIKITTETDSKASKEIIKIKCRNCGYLDTEDAEFCSKCGSKI